MQNRCFLAASDVIALQHRGLLNNPAVNCFHEALKFILLQVDSTYLSMQKYACACTAASCHTSPAAAAHAPALVCVAILPQANTIELPGMLKLMFSSGTSMVRPFGRVMVASAKLLRARVHSRRTMPGPQLLTGSAAMITIQSSFAGYWSDTGRITDPSENFRAMSSSTCEKD
jgi:hypothetical protein